MAVCGRLYGQMGNRIERKGDCAEGMTIWQGSCFFVSVGADRGRGRRKAGPTCR